MQLQVKNNIKIQVIDVRSKEEFEEAHIPDAINISLNELPERIAQLDKKVKYITACGKGGGRSTQASELLRNKGFISYWLCGGTFKWLNIQN